MKVRMLTYALVVAPSLLGLVQASDLSDQIWPQGQDRQAQLLVQGATAWQTEAMLFVGAESQARATTEEIQTRAKAGYEILVRGSSLVGVDRDLGAEFTAALSDADLSQVFNYLETGSAPSRDAAKAELKLSREVLYRPGLATDYQRAVKQAAKLTFVLAAKPADIQARLTELKRSLSLDAANAEIIDDLIQITKEPKTVEHFELSLEMMRFTAQRQARETSVVPCMPIVGLWKKHGTEHFLPSRHGGSAKPMEALARATFHTHAWEPLMELEGYVRSHDVGPEAKVAVLAHAAIAHFAGYRLEAAARCYEDIVASGLDNAFVKEAAYERANILEQMDRPMDAAVALLDAQAMFPRDAAYQAKAQKLLEFLLESRLLSLSDVTATYNSRQLRRQTALKN